MVTMTVFITDARHGDRFTQLRKDIFGGSFPASALITVAGLARPTCSSRCRGLRSSISRVASKWAGNRSPQRSGSGVRTGAGSAGGSRAAAAADCRPVRLVELAVTRWATSRP